MPHTAARRRLRGDVDRAVGFSPDGPAPILPSTPASTPGSTPANPTVGLSAEAFERLRGVVPRVADEAVTTIMREVPSYAGPFSDAMGQRIRVAVQMALMNLLELARVGSGTDPAKPIAPSTAAAYELGRGEARSGRSMDALLAAYRVGARVAWRGLSREAVAHGVGAQALGGFAELVFAYIDALSGASLAGHADELASAGRARERYRERLALLLIQGAEETELAAAARRAEWTSPRTLTAVLLPDEQVAGMLGVLDSQALYLALDPATLGDQPIGAGLRRGADTRAGRQPAEATGDEPLLGVLLVPNASGADRERLLRHLDGRAAVLGPERPWAQARASFERAERARRTLPRPPLRGVLDTDACLPQLLLTADPDVLEDLRAQALAPLTELRPSVRGRLEETLRSWLLHHGRRELIATDLFVHPQTVRYRMGQLRELFGARLDDPQEVLRLTLALALAGPTAPATAPPGPKVAALAAPERG